MKTKEQRNKDFEKQYANGKVCPVCGKYVKLKDWRFKPDSNYLSQCVTCNKLVSTVSTIKRKLKANPDYCESRMYELKKQIKLHELIYENPSATAFDIVKLLTGNITIDEFYNKIDINAI